MSTIRETIEGRLREAGLSNYARQAEPVVTALEEREADISMRLADYAVDKGLSSNEATELLSSLGMQIRSNGTTAEDPRIAQMEEQITAMQQTLRELREG
jgi:hypothetical protein